MKFMRSFVGGAAAAMLAFASAAQAQPVSLRIFGAFGAEHTGSKAIEIFKTEVARRSQGSISVEVRADVTQGAKDLIDNVRADSIFATWCTIPFISRLVPDVEALSLPFIFRDYNQLMRAVDGPAGRLIEAKLAAKGFTVLGWMWLGSRHVTNAKRPLKTPDDLKGLKIRVQPSETHLATFRALGADPVAMDIKDVYRALQQGDIDGQENPYSVIHANKFNETQKYLSDSGHVLDLIVFIANRKALMSLSPEQQKAIRDSARFAVAQQHKMAAEAEAVALAGLKDKGMQFDPLPPATRVALRKSTSVVIDSVRKRLGAQLVDKVVAEARRP